jgi:hypothetical protein
MLNGPPESPDDFSSELPVYLINAKALTITHLRLDEPYLLSKAHFINIITLTELLMPELPMAQMVDATTVVGNNAAHWIFVMTVFLVNKRTSDVRLWLSL